MIEREKIREGLAPRGYIIVGLIAGAVIAIDADCAARGLVLETAAPHVLRHTFAHRYLSIL